MYQGKTVQNFAVYTIYNDIALLLSCKIPFPTQPMPCLILCSKVLNSLNSIQVTKRGCKIISHSWKGRIANQAADTVGNAE